MPTVLLVEDNDDVREMMSTALQLAGTRVVTAANGREALAVLERTHPCVIVLDLMMPVMNGWELRAALKRDPSLSAIPVIVVSALTEDLVARMGATEYLEKPVDIDRLIETVCELCN
jgi:CheY-like chemotaxis protein